MPPAASAALQRGLRDPSFVGRAAELAAFQRALEWARSWRGDLALVEGPSGGGKTRLLDELAARMASHGALVLRGQGRADAPVPLLALDQVVQQLVQAARGHPALATGLRERLGDERDAACAALPQLTGALGPAPEGPLGPEQHGEERTLRALSALLDALGERDRPVLLLLDDGQWLDELTVKLLQRWRAGRDAAGESHVLVVLAFRGDEVGKDHPLRSLAPVLHVELGPLPAQDVRALVESMGGPLPAGTADEIVRAAKGSPFAAVALLQGYAEEGGAALHLGEGAAQLVHARLSRLPHDARRLLAAGAVLGRSFEVALAAALVGQSGPQAAAALDEARRRLMVLSDEAGKSASFAHDKLREAVLSGLDEPDKRALHVRAALELAARGGGQDFDIAFHFDAGGEPGRALAPALRAAERARARNALEIAELNYRVAERGCGYDREARRAVAEGLGDVLMLRGHYAESETKLREALSLAAAPLERARLEGKLGELAFRRGDLGTATASLEGALRDLGQLVPRTRPGYAAVFAWELCKQVLHSLAPGVFTGRPRPAEFAERDLLAARLFGRLSYAYYYTRFPLAPLWAHLRELNLAERYPETQELAASYSKHVLVLLWVPFLERARLYADKALALYQRLADAWGEGHARFLAGAGLATVSRYEEALELLRRARELLQRTGDRWEENAAGANGAICLYFMGDLPAAAREGEHAVRVARQIGDWHAIGISAKVWSLASGGRVPAELIAEALPAAGEDALTKSGLFVADGTRLLREGKLDEAVRVLEGADELLRETGVKVDFVATVPAQLATALRLAAERAADAGRPLAIERAQRVAGRAVKLGRRFPNHLSHALREAALVEALAGRHARAQKVLGEASSAAARLAQRYEAAQCALAAARMSALRGDASAEPARAAALADLRALGADFALGEPLPT